jgi:hypothetical protein
MRRGGASEANLPIHLPHPWPDCASTSGERACREGVMPMIDPSCPDARAPDRRATRVLLLLLAAAGLQAVDIVTLHQVMSTSGVWVEHAVLPGRHFPMEPGDTALLVRLGTLAACLGGLYAARRSWLAELGAAGVFVLSALLLVRWSMYLDLLGRLPVV